MSRATLKKDTHGHIQCYNAGCRCEVCREEHNARMRESRARRVQEAKNPNDPRHGTQSFYINHGCRCNRCTKAHAAGCARTRKRIK